MTATALVTVLLAAAFGIAFWYGVRRDRARWRRQRLMDVMVQVGVAAAAMAAGLRGAAAEATHATAALRAWLDEGENTAADHHREKP